MFLPRAKANRLKRLPNARDDIGFIQDLADEIGAAHQSRLFEGPWTIEALERAALEWANAIQFSPPRSALHDNPAALLSTLYARYVDAPTGRRKRRRGRRWLQRRVQKALVGQLTTHRPEIEIESVIALNRVAQGELDEHVVDLTLLNGAPRAYIQTLSFEVGEPSGVRKEVNALKWTIDDLRNVQNVHRVPVTIVTIGASDLLETAERVYKDLEAAVVHEEEIEPWVSQTARELAGHLH
jgi:hypothetical protein